LLTLVGVIILDEELKNLLKLKVKQNVKQKIVLKWGYPPKTPPITKLLNLFQQLEMHQKDW